MANLMGLRWWFDLVGFGGGLQERGASASFGLWVAHGCAHGFCGSLDFWWVSVLIGGIGLILVG